MGLPTWPGYSRLASASKTGQGFLGLVWASQVGLGILDWPELPGLATGQGILELSWVFQVARGISDGQSFQDWPELPRLARVS